MQAIETRYNGYHFRSRLEARWAVFFEHCRLPYLYEPEAYDLSQVRCQSDACGHNPDCCCHALKEMGNVTLYLPDFFLPTLRLRDETPGVFFEVKGQHDRTADAKATILGHLTTRPVVIAEVAPLPRWGETGLYQHYPWWDNYMLFMRCVRCGETKIEFSESSYMICPACGAEATDDHQTLGEAMHAAREKRFERRESHA